MLVRPYGVTGIGVAFIEEVVNFDFTGIDFGDVSDERLTKPLIELGGGVEIGRGLVVVDVGYRFRKLLDTEPPVNISSVTTGVGLRF